MEDIINVTFEDPDWNIEEEEVEQPTVGKVSSGHINAQEAVREKKCIAYNSCLLNLVKMSIGSHCSKCKGGLKFSNVMKGTCLVVMWKCTKNHQHYGSWASQPRIHNMYAANLLVPSCLVTSGNNYQKVALMARFLNLGFVSESSHYR